MNQSDFQDFCKLLDGAALATNQEPKSRETIAVLFKFLQDLEIEQVADAVKLHIGESRFFPTVADIRNLAEGTGQEKANLAWSRVLQSARVHGRYTSIRYGDPRIHYAISQMGGWESICNIATDRLNYEAIQFCRYWREADRKQMQWGNPQVPALFMSGHDRSNLKKGFNDLVRTPVLVDCQNLNKGNPPEIKALPISGRRRPKLERIGERF